MSTRQKFLEDLLALLEKYEVEIVADDHWSGYAGCGQDIRIEVEFEDWATEDIDFGRCIDASKIKSIIG